MNDRRPRLLLPLVVAVCAIANPASAQTAPSEPTATILQRDGLFWKACNACDVEAMPSLAAEGRRWRMTRVLSYDHGPAVRSNSAAGLTGSR